MLRRLSQPSILSDDMRPAFARSFANEDGGRGSDVLVLMTGVWFSSCSCLAYAFSSSFLKAVVAADEEAFKPSVKLALVLALRRGSGIVLVEWGLRRRWCIRLR